MDTELHENQTLAILLSFTESDVTQDLSSHPLILQRGSDCFSRTLLVIFQRGGVRAPSYPTPSRSMHSPGCKALEYKTLVKMNKSICCLLM